MTTNIVSTCYAILDKNLAIFNDLVQYDVDHSQNITEITSFVNSQTCCQKYYCIIKTLLDATQYISNSTFITILNHNFDEIVDLVTNQNYEPILITTQESLTKSNIFYSLYTLQKLRERGIILTHVYSKIIDILDGNQGEQNLKHELGIDTDKNILIILCDDISYSGTQLGKHINESPFGVPNYYPGYNFYEKRKLNNRIRIFLNIIGLLPEARRVVTSQFNNQSNLILPQHIISFTGNITVNDVIEKNARDNGLTKNMFLKLFDCWVLNRTANSIILESKFIKENLFNNDELTSLSLVYPFQKYPDALSTYSKLCYIKNFNKMITLDVDNFITKFNITPEKFCQKISDGIDLKTLLRQLEIPNSDAIVMNIFSNYDDLKITGEINWLKNCGEIINPLNFTNKQGTWFRSMNNFKSEQKYLSDFNGACNTSSGITSFYKNIPITLDGVTNILFKDLSQIHELLNQPQPQQETLKKYLKYKNKYLYLKKKLNK